MLKQDHRGITSKSDESKINLDTSACEELATTMEGTNQYIFEGSEPRQQKLVILIIKLVAAVGLAVIGYFLYTGIEQHRLTGAAVGVPMGVAFLSVALSEHYGFVTKNKRKLILSGLICLLLFVLNHRILDLLSTADEIDYTLGYVIYIGTIAISIFTIFEAKITKQLYQFLPIGWNLLLMGIVSFFTFFIVEICTGTNIFEIDGSYWMTNIMIYLAFYAFIYLLTMRMKLSLIIGLALCAIAGVANGFVIVFRGSPILPADLFLIKTAMEVGGNYSFEPTVGMLIGIAAIIITVMLIWNIKEVKVKWKGRLGGAIAYVLFLCFGLIHFQQVAQTQLYMVNLWQPVRTYQRYGTGYGFGLNVIAMQVQKPEGYSNQKVQEILSKYMSDPVADGTTEKLPNIIAITCEAFSDLSIINDFDTNEEYMPYLNSLSENIIKGNAYVSVLGGRTSNSEYEFLTGNAITYLPAGTVPYQQYINGETDNLTSVLKSMNYSATALHPYSRNTYRREIVYPLLGFDEYVSIESFSSPRYLRYYIQDQSDFEKIIELYEARDTSKPFFLYNVTMQNHSAYNTGKMKNNIWVTDEDGQVQKDFSEASEYLSCISYTDNAIKTLIEYFKNQSEPTYIIFFGDHQPNLDDGFLEYLFNGKGESELTTEEMQKRYTVPFFIWSNQDIEEKTVDAISLNYLSSFFLKEAGMPLTAFNKYMLDLYEQIPVVNINGYIDKEGTYYDTSAMKENELLNEYNMLLYNSVMNNNNGVEWAYELQQETTE